MNRTDTIAPRTTDWRSLRHLSGCLRLTVLGLVVLGLFGVSRVDSLAAEADELPNAPAEVPAEAAPPVPSAADILQQAADQATQADLLAQRATSAADWDQVVALWLEAIATARSIPPASPARIFAQRQLRSYLQHLSAAQQRTEQASPTANIPSLGSPLLDAQLAGYLSYVATAGTPDILVVGSSRSLQGIDPQVMQQRLAAQGYPNLRVYNFSVNGATAQFVNFVLSELLPAPLPAVIIWGDGSRAFNDGRRDRTWESLVASPGYQAIHQGMLPAASLLDTLAAGPASVVTVRSPVSASLSSLDALGFSAVGDRFDPPTYYQQFPKVNGRNDGAYRPFSLDGAQSEALGQLAGFTSAQNSQLIFVNLPLTGSYLDDFRLVYERQFQQFLQAQSQAQGFEVIDLLTQWQTQSAFFADPSHLNQTGAAAIAQQLAQHPTVRSALAPPEPPSPQAPPSLQELLNLPDPSDALTQPSEPGNPPDSL